jgi:hypothetical protein
VRRQTNLKGKDMRKLKGFSWCPNSNIETTLENMKMLLNDLILEEEGGFVSFRGFPK